MSCRKRRKTVKSALNVIPSRNTLFLTVTVWYLYLLLWYIFCSKHNILLYCHPLPENKNYSYYWSIGKLENFETSRFESSFLLMKLAQGEKAFYGLLTSNTWQHILMFQVRHRWWVPPSCITIWFFPHVSQQQWFTLSPAFHHLAYSLVPKERHV